METGHSQTVTDANGQKCSAYDCPLVGTCSTSVNGSSHWTCRFHYAEKSANWQALTLFIKNNIDLYQAYVKLLKMPVIDWEDNRKKWMKAALPPEENEDLYTYRSRVFRYFQSKISV